MWEVRRAVVYDQFENTVTMQFSKIDGEHGPGRQALHVRRAEGRGDRPAAVELRAMPADNSFDIVCKIDMQEVTNGLDQARREIDTRYDLKGSKNEIELEKTDIKVTAPTT